MTTESPPRARPDPLFLERLDAFMERSLSEIRSFSLRENHPFEETRRHVAEWHCKYLFQLPAEQSDPTASSSFDKRAHVRNVLCSTSRALESLHSISGVHSFILATNPVDPSDEGFLGGTIQGREFWRSIRGGGHVGARTFKAYCLKHATDVTHSEDQPGGSCLAEEAASTLPSAKRTPASSLKAALYSTIRDALRAASGIRNAEMKWSNHDRLSAYGVQLVGWPEDVPKQNPSTLTAGQNKLLLESLEKGIMKFIAKEEQSEGSSSAPVQTDGRNCSRRSSSAAAEEAVVEFSWVYEKSRPSSQPMNTPLLDQVAPKSAAEILRDANMEIISADADPPGAPILRLGPPDGGTHYLDSHSNYRIINQGSTTESTARKRRREDDSGQDTDLS